MTKLKGYFFKVSETKPKKLVKTKIPKDRVQEIKGIFKAIDSKDFLSLQNSLSYGGIKDSNNRNIKKQFNNIKNKI